MFNIDTAYTNPHDVFNKKAAQEYLSNRKNFMTKARKITKKYANKKW